MTKALYPGTFDPLTRGHEDIVRRAARLFDSVVLGIADSRSKSPIFDVDERIALAREALADCPGVEIIRISGLMIDVMKQIGADVVVRGVRSVSDFDYELQLAGMNREMMPEAETIFLTPAIEHQFVSGTLVREIAMMGGRYERFVSPTVASWMRRKLDELGRG
ncbi:MAG: pantetheine-phosphate adenylyltransferase [Burkholderiaceae bacterium]|jgi:pantetheine-phosphate adenylyltransferase|nr:pantetheine-phosphate adenylyltransferase [Burkholderiaceae bacterium]MEB2318928.1 pantetheine-phosphate adenylyltransferase [Pseudomonadota bacterium]